MKKRMAEKCHMACENQLCPPSFSILNKYHPHHPFSLWTLPRFFLSFSNGCSVLLQPLRENDTLISPTLSSFHRRKMKTPLLSLLIFFTLTYVHNSAAAAAAAASKDSEQLLRFKASLPNPTVLPSWVSTADPCNFAAVTCKSSRVSSIDLDSVDLATGFHSVASYLLSLDHLESISLKSTNLAGTIAVPTGFRCGALLSSLDLSRNNLSGGMSHLSSCASLSFLNLSGNRMSGDVDVSSLEKLVHLDISSNNFSASVPKLGSCMAMAFLDLSTNHFCGEIGSALSGCSQLTFLNLSVNQFSGAIPPLPTAKIQYLYLSSNAFQGQIPASLADACPTLVELDLSLNHLSGDLPTGLSACTVLQLFDISNNNFTGELPGDVVFTGMANLKKLVLAFNGFNGPLPQSISKLTTLETLDLSSNSLSGTIPGGLCNAPANSLKVLYLQNNLFGGPIPPTLSNCSHLVSLDLSFNYLTGTIPASLRSLRELKDMIFLLNHLEGEIPKELMYIQTLENLILDFNFLSGTIPAELSNCTELNWVSLSNNRFGGHIPGWFGQLSNLAILKLSNNSFYGPIPTELGDSRSLIWLDLNTNLLSGEIPAALFKQSGSIAVKLINDKRYAYIKNDGSRECHGAGNLLEFAGIRPEQLNRISTRNPCNFTRVYKGLINPTFKNNGSMIFLDISYNSLTGSIPKEIGSMYYLNILNLGSNNLTGSIPREIGDLRNLNILDLSENRLEGIIPQSLAGCSMLSEINLSNNLLTGPIPSMGQLGTFATSSFFNNSGLCGIPLPPCAKTSSSNGSSEHSNSHRKAASIAGSVAMGLLFALLCIIGFVFVAIDSRKKRLKLKEAESVDVYVDSLSENTNWKLTSAREALSINLATFEKPLKKLTFADLLEATNGFHPDSLIGSGGFGDVYRAELKDGTVVAIKKLIQVSGQGDREFMAEMETIGKIKHRNLVSLLGYCKVKEERLLVYEFMKYGSLEDVLHDEKLGKTIDWPARRRIAIGAARGLAFLHHNCIPHIIHRDMKSSNVLIDENLDARVSDFGMARLMSAMDTHLSVSTLAGTPGYVPPEYYQSFRCSTKGDVYSFGVVLLELLTGRRPTDSADFGDNNIVGWVKHHARLRISDVLDPRLIEADPRVEDELVQHLKVAIACLDDRPLKRPTIIQVLASFKEIQSESGLDSSSSGVAPADAEFGVAGMSIEEEDSRH